MPSFSQLGTVTHGSLLPLKFHLTDHSSPLYPLYSAAINFISKLSTAPCGSLLPSTAFHCTSLHPTSLYCTLRTPQLSATVHCTLCTAFHCTSQLCCIPLHLTALCCIPLHLTALCDTPQHLPSLCYASLHLTALCRTSLHLTALSKL